MSNQGLSINVDAVWDDDCIIGSELSAAVYREHCHIWQPELWGYFLGRANHSGAPVINTYRFTGDVGAEVMISKVTDNPVKTMMVLPGLKAPPERWAWVTISALLYKPQDTFVLNRPFLKSGDCGAVKRDSNRHPRDPGRR